VALDSASLGANLAEGNWGSAAVDGVALLVHVVATAVPGVPGGAGTVVHSLRAADKAVDVAKAADKAADVAKGVDKAADVAKAGDKAKDAGKGAAKLAGDAARGERTTEPTLPSKTVASDKGVTVEHYYRSGDHGPAHAHVVGGGDPTKIGANGKPLAG
jgi:hypothetical protein